MTIADPYPADLEELDAPAITANPDAVANRLITAINRLALAMEQQNAQGRPAAPQVASAPTLAALPPVQGVVAPQAATADVCPIHLTPWKTVPAGISKKNGNPYTAFRACSTAGCDQRPRI